MNESPGPRPPVDRYLSVGDAAEYLGVSRTTLRAWADRGIVPCAVTFGGHRRFRIHDLDRVERKSRSTVATS